MAVLLKRKHTNITMIEKVTIMPGVNRLEDEQVEKMKKNPAWESMLESGVHSLIVKKADPEISMEDTTSSISEMNVKDAVKIIKATADRDSLMAMQEEEDAGQKRKGVFDAIEAQLEATASDKKDEDEDNENDE